MEIDGKMLIKNKLIRMFGLFLDYLVINLFFLILLIICFFVDNV